MSQTTEYSHIFSVRDRSRAEIASGLGVNEIDLHGEKSKASKHFYMLYEKGSTTHQNIEAFRTRCKDVFIESIPRIGNTNDFMNYIKEFASRCIFFSGLNEDSQISEILKIQSFCDNTVYHISFFHFSTNCSLVIMDSVEKQKELIEYFCKNPLIGIRATPFYERSFGESDSQGVLQINNLPFSTKREDLWNKFSKYGRIEYLEISYGPMLCLIGYILFVHYEDALTAKKDLNDRSIFLFHQVSRIEVIGSFASMEDINDRIIVLESNENEWDLRKSLVSVDANTIRFVSTKGENNCYSLVLYYSEKQSMLKMAKHLDERDIKFKEYLNRCFCRMNQVFMKYSVPEEWRNRFMVVSLPYSHNMGINHLFGELIKIEEIESVTSLSDSNDNLFVLQKEKSPDVIKSSILIKTSKYFFDSSLKLAQELLYPKLELSNRKPNVHVSRFNSLEAITEGLGKR